MKTEQNKNASPKRTAQIIQMSGGGKKENNSILHLGKIKFSLFFIFFTPGISSSPRFSTKDVKREQVGTRCDSIKPLPEFVDYPPPFHHNRCQEKTRQG
jgi:hypothetical protein